MKCRYYNIGIDYCVRDICEMASKVFLNVEMTFSDFFYFDADISPPNVLKLPPQDFQYTP